MSGVQLDRGLYAPLIVEPRREPLSYDREAVLMFDDWLDGLAGTPERRLALLRANGMDMGAMHSGSGAAMNGMGAMDNGGRGRSRHTSVDGRAPGPNSLARLPNELEAGRLDPGDVRDYPLYLANGRPPDDPARITVRKGDRLRLRLINPSADTIFCVFVERHELEVVHADGLAVRPVRTDAVVLGMGERYDAGCCPMETCSPPRPTAPPARALSAGSCGWTWRCDAPGTSGRSAARHSPTTKRRA